MITSKYKKSEEQKKKISDTLKLKFKSGELICPWKGRERSKEHSKKLSLALKGKTSPMKDKHHSEETKEKLRKINLGKISPMKGKFQSEETKEKMSKAHKGKPNYKNRGKSSWIKGKHLTLEHKNNISKSHKGIKMSDTNKQKLIGSHGGYKPWNYIDGRSKDKGPARYGDDWDKIRMIIYKRDNFTCQFCGITMKETKKAHHIHHLNPFVDSKDNSLENLLTLCPSCHRKEEARLMRLRKKIKNKMEAKDL